MLTQCGPLLPYTEQGHIDEREGVSSWRSDPADVSHTGAPRRLITDCSAGGCSAARAAAGGQARYIACPPCRNSPSPPIVVYRTRYCLDSLRKSDRPSTSTRDDGCWWMPLGCSRAWARGNWPRFGMSPAARCRQIEAGALAQCRY